MKILRIAACVLALCAACTVSAATSDTWVVQARVNTIALFGDYGSGGDVWVNVTGGSTGGVPSGCTDGFWLAPNAQANYKSLLAALMLAKSTGGQVSMYGDSTLLWVGSNGKYCKLNLVLVL